MALLHTEVLANSNPAPQQWIAFTHGVFGTGGNWRSIARKVIEAAPSWGAVLVDLRGHGKSPRGTAPHALSACAGDLVETFSNLSSEGIDIAALSGHSFGGKVAMMLSEQDGYHPVQRFILDSSPSPRPKQANDGSVPAVLKLLKALPTKWPSRDAFVAAVVAGGQPLSIAQWLGLSVQRHADATDYRLHLELDAISDMLDNYFIVDAWPAITTDTRAPIDFIIGATSDTLSVDDRNKLLTAPPHVSSVEIHAGHWLHIDAPAAVISLISTKLPR
jgi:esterase